MSTMYTIPTNPDAGTPALPYPPHLNIPLIAHPLRFLVRAVTPIHFHSFKGSALRGALTTSLRRTFCPEWRAAQTDSLHQSLCPICQLLSIEHTDEASGDLRRPYTIEPPLDARDEIAPGEHFSFGLTLFGDKVAYLPYLILAVQGMGEGGVGQKRTGEVDAQGQGSAGRGRFELAAIDAVNPLTDEQAPMLRPGERMVRAGTAPVTHEDVERAANEWAAQLAAHGNRLTIHFHTPTRITQREETLKQPLFFPLVKQVVLRVLDLCAQHANGRPTLAGQPLVLKRDLYPYADTVQLVDDHTRWWDVKGYSARLERPQVIGGLVGQATYVAPDWRPLLPWLLWGSLTHVGKNAVKGCGLYDLQPPAY
jgi:hypothetical protein